MKEKTKEDKKKIVYWRDLWVYTGHQFHLLNDARPVGLLREVHRHVTTVGVNGCTTTDTSASSTHWVHRSSKGEEWRQLLSHHFFFHFFFSFTFSSVIIFLFLFLFIFFFFLGGVVGCVCVCVCVCVCDGCFLSLVSGTLNAHWLSYF